VTDWETIEETFTRLRDFVFTDLGRLVNQEAGGNFAVVALVMTACDALGRLHYGKDKGVRILEECLPEEWKPAAPILSDALRHGLIHGYEAQSVVVDGGPMYFQIAWSGERHLTFTDESRHILCIVAPVLVESLRGAFDSIEAELRINPRARDEFLVRDRKDREIHLRGSLAESWRDVVTSARVVAYPRAAGVDSAMGEGATGPKIPGS
jgi:hypothetical protein